MYTVGLTGGIGAGKSTVANYFAARGIVIVDTDLIAREIVEPGTPCLQRIVEHFGAEVLQNDDSLYRKKLREIIFSDPAEKAWLEQLMHPIIRTTLVERLQRATSPYAILSTPLLFETNDTDLVNRILVVDIPPLLQVSRTVARDRVSVEQTRKITATQIDRHRRLELADDIIDNTGSLRATEQQVHTLHQKYLTLAKP